MTTQSISRRSTKIKEQGEKGGKEGEGYQHERPLSLNKGSGRLTVALQRNFYV